MRHVDTQRLAAIGLFWLAAGLPQSTFAAAGQWTLLPEMKEPEGFVVAAEADREALTASTEGRRAMARLEALVLDDWQALQTVDWLGLSRYQLEATAGWALPDSPGPLVSRVLGRDEAGRFHVETRGPRLPARFDIVYRYVWAFAIYDPLSGEIARPVVTIRGWIEE